MEPHDSRDLDEVIDGVARALTSSGPARELRAPVASRLSSRSPWSFGWRAGLAVAAIGAVVLAVVVLRSGTPSPSSRVVSRSPPPVEPAAVTTAPQTAVAREAASRPPVIQRARGAVGRQVVVDAADTQDIVAIEPMAIVPLRDDRPAAAARARIEIAPIDVEPVRIRELGEAAE